MLSFKKSVFLLSTVFVLHNNDYAVGKSLDDYGAEFWETQTGSQLHKHYPHLKPEAAVKRGIKDFVALHRGEIEKQSTSAGTCLFDYTKQDEEIKKLFAQIEPLLKKEIYFRKTHVFAYTGYSAAVAQFNTCLDEGNALLAANDKAGNPLHYKTAEQNKIKNRDQFLQGYFNGYKEHIEERNKKGENISLFDQKRRSGFGKAPDGSDYAKTHLKCTNISLFGNFKRSDPYECTLFFYVTAGNVGQVNDSLTTNYFKSIGIISPNATQAEIDAKLTPYKQMHMEKMAKGGGGLMQFKIANEYADQNMFFSYAKGVPCYVSRKTGKVMNKGHDKPLPRIDAGGKNRYIPSVAKDVQLYKQNPKKFEKKFDNDMGNVQLRMIVNPKACANKNVMKTSTTTRFPVSYEDRKEYEAKVHIQFSNDLIESVNKNQMSESFSKTTVLGKLKNFALATTAVGYKDISILLSNVVKSSKIGFLEAVGIVKKGTAAVAAANKEITSRLGILDKVCNAYDTLKKMSKDAARDAITQFTKASV